MTRSSQNREIAPSAKGAGFSFVENSFDLAWGEVRAALFRKLTTNSCNLFLRGGDVISVSPLLSGTHEPALTNLIDSFSEAGYSDFLIDIGANIGLISCQVGLAFEEIHMYEPNPLCRKILEVNAAIALDGARCNIYPVGLGDKDKTVCLTVPKQNWGGAFVEDSSNSYDAATLAAKDRFTSLDSKNYFDVEIEIRDTATELRGVFSDLGSRGRSRGVIKIDVEGYEPVVLKGIADALPRDMSVYIVFESWDPNFDIDDILKAFGGRARAVRLVRHIPWKRSWWRWAKALSLCFSGKIVTRLEPVTSANCNGDIVLEIA